MATTAGFTAARADKKRLYKAGISKLRPADQIRPVKRGLNPARESVSSWPEAIFC